MLSIGKLAAGAGDYYTAMVANGAEEYFTGAREAPGEWVGAGSDVLALLPGFAPNSVGDQCQLPEIEAGGGFVGLADRSA